MDNTIELEKQIAKKTAEYNAKKKKVRKADFGLPKPLVGYTFPSKSQIEELQSQKDFYNYSWS